MPLDLRRRVAVVGVGCTPFGDLYEKSARGPRLRCGRRGARRLRMRAQRLEAACVGTVMSTFSGENIKPGKGNPPRSPTGRVYRRRPTAVVTRLPAIAAPVEAPPPDAPPPPVPGLGTPGL